VVVVNKDKDKDKDKGKAFPLQPYGAQRVVGG
jgi:hypothetical protein